jgi:tRNA nucleotidyltransferase/poly(A) polymerase
MDVEAQVIAWLAEQDMPIYLVGGWVRDRLRGRPNCDLDLVVDGDSLTLARRLADRLHGHYYPLDTERGTGRAIFHRDDSRLVVDIARFRGPDLRADLRARDFTINALAADVRAPETVIDHHGGLADLTAGVIRPVSEESICSDPLRALRAVRQAAELGFTLAPETEVLIQRDGNGLREVSGERVRDELARLLARPDVAHHLHLLDRLGLLVVLFPELEPLRGLQQPPPHHLTGLAHSLAVVGALEAIIAAVRCGKGPHGLPMPGPYTLGEGLLQPYQQRLEQHLAEDLGYGRPRLVTLKLSALLHDTGKPQARSVEPDRETGDGKPGRIRFIGHEVEGADVASAVLTRLRFDRGEVQLARIIVRHHMRPLLLADQPRVSNRAVYRFFRDTGTGGVDVLLHALADHLATYAPGLGQDRWQRLMALTERMLADYWHRPTQRVEPPALIDGHDLLAAFDLEPGPLIGELLEAVREAQVEGEVDSREEALALARERLRGGQSG